MLLFGLLLMVCWSWLVVIGVFVALGVLPLVVCVVFGLLVCFFFQYSLSFLYLVLFFALCVCTCVCIVAELRC